MRRFPTTRRGERGIEATTPATHDAGGVGVSQIQIRSRCSRDTHPPCLRSDTRADLHARGRVASPRIAVVIDTFPLPFAPVSVKSRMRFGNRYPQRRELLRNFIPEPARFPREDAIRFPFFSFFELGGEANCSKGVAKKLGKKRGDEENLG